jgi:hypothetical protein
LLVLRHTSGRWAKRGRTSENEENALHALPRFGYPTPTINPYKLNGAEMIMRIGL